MKTVEQRLLAYAQLIRFDKPVGTLLLLWPALWGLLLSQAQWPKLENIIIFSLGTFLMRSAGCAINDYADRKIDSQVTRTQARPLARGAIYAWEAVVIALLFALLALVLVLQTNQVTIFLSIGAVLLAGIYPFSKRWFAAPQLFLGAAFAWAIPMGFAAELGYVKPIAWLYYLLSLLWILAYDTYYALADRADDLSLAIHSSAILFGDDATKVALQSNLVFLCGFHGLLIGEINWAKSIFWPELVVLLSSMLICIGLAIWQHRLANTLKPFACIKAFKLNNFSGGLITLAVVAQQLLSSNF